MTDQFEEEDDATSLAWKPCRDFNAPKKTAIAVQKVGWKINRAKNSLFFALKLPYVAFLGESLWANVVMAEWIVRTPDNPATEVRFVSSWSRMLFLVVIAQFNEHLISVYAN